MASDDRFYLLELRHRPAMCGDIGSILRIDGLVVGGEGGRVILMLPSAAEWTDAEKNHVHFLSMEQWVDFIQRSDVPEILVGPAKVFHRKARYEISGAVQQKVWMADNCACVYCGQPMGKVQLTIDHFTPLEMGGKNDTSNYLTACRKCNKDKGGMSPEQWCSIDKVKWAYDAYVEYLAERKIP